jgi:AcrR family transcriptional regulator
MADAVMFIPYTVQSFMRTGEGDPVRTLALLWRRAEGGRRGPRPKLSVDAVVEAAIALADEAGLEAVSMRAVAERLGVSAMTLYTYVPGKSELVDLMLDALWLAMPREAQPTMRSVADANRALYEAHPWAARVTTARPPLGPGLLAKYEHELAAFEGLGLSDVDMDAALTLVLGFVQGIAAQEPATTPDAEWWEAAGPLLAELVDPDDYPLASRVGSAAGEAQGGAYDADRAYRFGLERIIEGLEP